MTESEMSADDRPPPDGAGTALTLRAEAERGENANTALPASALVRWIQHHQVLVAGLVLVAADLVWRAQILSHLFFRQDDFETLDLAFRSSLNVHYLTFIGSGDLMMGQRLLALMLSRVALYDWALASAIILVLFGASALAGLRLLRTMFGEHPAILLALALYLLSPLTVPAFGWWSSAVEEVPLQLAIFTALNAHVLYLRGRQKRHLAAAIGWVAFGLFFYEKGLVLPPLLFAVTAAYFAGGRFFLSGARLALSRYRTAWLSYAALLVGYSILLATSLGSAIAQPHVPHSIGTVARFSWSV